MANRLLDEIRSGNTTSVPVSNNRLLSDIKKDTRTSSRIDISSLMKQQSAKPEQQKTPQPGIDFTPISEFPKEPSILEKIKSFLFSDSGKFSDQQIMDANPTLKEGLVGGAKFIGKQIAGIGQLPSIAVEAFERNFGDTGRADYLKKLREEGGLQKLADISEPSTPGEAKVSRGADIVTLIPGLIKKSVTKALVTATTRDAVNLALKKEGINVSEEVADQIAKETNLQKIEKLLSNENIAPVKKTALEEARAVTAPAEKPKILERVMESAKALPTKVQESFTTRFIQVQKFADEQLKKAGVNVTASEKNALIKEFENYSSAKAAASARVNKFKEDVIDPVNVAGVRDDFNTYLFLKRTETRLNSGVKTGDWTPEKVTSALTDMRRELGERMDIIESSAGRFQGYADEVMETLRDSGVLSKDGFDAIKKTNDFYAPFKLMKYIGDDDIIGNAGKSLNLSGQDVIKSMKGISSQDIRLSDLTDEMAKKLYQTRLIAEKNRIMKEFAKLADLKDSSVRKIRTAQKVKARINVFKALKNNTSGIKKLKRLLSTSSRWEKKLRSELKSLNIKGLGLALSKKTQEAIKKKSVEIRSTKNKAIVAAEKEIQKLKEAIKNIQKTASKEEKIVEDGVTFIKKGSKKLLTKERLKKLEALKKRLVKATEKLEEAKKLTDEKEFIYATTTATETKKFVNELVNLSDSALESIKKKIANREPKLALIIDQVRGIKNAIEVKKLDRTGLKGQANALADAQRSAVANGMDVVHYMDDGIVNILEVPKEVAKAIKGLNAEQLGVLSRGMRYAAVPARAGITTLNIGFQGANMLVDIARLATISKFRIKNPVDAGLFVYDYARAFIESIGGNVDDVVSKISGGKIRTKSKDYNAAETAGAFQGTVYNSYLKEFGKTSGPVASKFHKTLDVFDKTGNAIEEASKLAGFKRGNRLLKEGKMDTRDLLYELRNYAGSPDFSRGGTLTPEANILFMFFNARVQGLSSDLRRLTGYSDGGKEAAKAWATIGTLVGMPVTLNAIRNNAQFQEDYNKLTDWEKANNIIIFRDSFVKDKNGEYVMDGDGKPIRDAYKIPVRDSLGAVKNLIETVVDSGYKDKSLAEDMIAFTKKTVEGFAPLNISGEGFEQKAESLVSGTNPLVKVIYETASGRDAYRHKDIEPEYIGGVETDRLPKELRKKDSTPDWAIRLGELTGQSPLVVEKIANDIGAGVFTQFKGTDQRGNALSRRFIRSNFYKGNEDFVKELEGMQQDEAVKKIGVYMKAKSIYESVKEMGPEEKKAVVRDLIERNEIDDEVAKQIIKLKDREQFGYSAEDAIMKDLGVENGARAKAIYRKLKTIDKPERKKYIESIAEKKILTDQVSQQLSFIISNKPLE